ncbi:PQQ-binding-like beta-propeller repeat protein [Ehrlichia canis]|uniref:Quino protein n=1 Tax=Ehrlichia canis (strain Jake) TaxID=269484 RepID=A0ACA6AVY1_EHRCJ|nr:PQQ-binding-like beta-propeller repeat protein [Ehrlichia canis]AAZ68558.1 quino protein [Ehrlichia canis str. Jake]
MIKSGIVTLIVLILLFPVLVLASGVVQEHSLYDVEMSDNSGGNHDKDVAVLASSRLSNRDVISLKMHQGVMPVFVNDRIIFLSRNGILHSVDSKNIEKCYWKLDLTKYSKMYRANILYSENMVFYIVDDNVYGIDFETGEIKWQKGLSSIIAGSPIVADNNLIVVTVDNNLSSFNVSDGSLLWSSQESLPEVKSYSSASSALYGNTVIFSFSNGKVIAFNYLNGLKMWESNVSKANIAFSNGAALQAANGTVIAVDKLHSISNIDIESGKTRWSKDLKVEYVSQIDGGNIAAIIDNKLVLLDVSTGNFLWQYDLLQHGKPKNKWCAPIIIGDKILVISNDGCMVYLDYKSGTLKMVNYILSSTYYVPVFLNSSVYIVTDKGKVVIFH